MKALHVHIDDDLADDLERYQAAQAVPPTMVAVVRAALRQLLRGPKAPPAWEPACPAPGVGLDGKSCGHRAIWMPGLELGVFCTHCGHWEIGPHEGEPGHMEFASRWRGGGR